MQHIKLPQLFLTPATQSEVDQLKELFNKGRDVDLFLCTNPHLIAALLLEYDAPRLPSTAPQLIADHHWPTRHDTTRPTTRPTTPTRHVLHRYLRELPEPLLCADGLFQGFMGVPKLPEEQQAPELAGLVAKLPEEHVQVLRYLFQLFQRLARPELAKDNAFDAEEVSNVVGPCILRDPNANGRPPSKREAKHIVLLTKMIIAAPHTFIPRLDTVSLDWVHTTHPARACVVCVVCRVSCVGVCVCVCILFVLCVYVCGAWAYSRRAACVRHRWRATGSC
jgi:hypothetical protein